MSSTNLTTRARILKSTQDLLEAGRVTEVRMSDIAKLSGISRQALYLHFPNRADLLVATTRYLDEVHAIETVFDQRVVPAKGLDKLTEFVAVWGNYIPKIHGVGKALMAMMDGDAEARAAWDNRMTAVRRIAASVVESLQDEGRLSPELSKKEATDLLWTLVSVRNWESLRHDCRWSQKRYISHMERAAIALLTA
ncbi:TetR/AcrR family transcriptional regulator [Sulfitobacter aestuariivivens]|uniref:TetR/AcrR family transcriptional regulator n=1 Tax=Sulfitobacter aestuariivivens TaxID=2766981 RepID=A0A927D6T7_9RHOB|nr:TetR/AcrR family transcriptional regulator [Sulfitobacter aestuariivivens]MBD3666065.1 TetR/AcrR family transcriptional regulator [Sulfitobacter aestuariivivens]